MTNRLTRYLLLVAPLLWAAPLAAQEQDTTRLPTGVRLGLIYQTAFRPRLAVRPFEGPPSLAAVMDEVYATVRRDLDYSDRFELAETPAGLAAGPVNYDAWNGLGVVFLVTGVLDPGPDGYLLRLALHDVVYGTVKEIRTFALPPATSERFRLSVHAAADELVRWATGQPGMAASRIAFVRSTGGGYELLVIDYDGENLRRIATSEDLLLSPAWSPDGRRIAYSAGPLGASQIVEYDLERGTTRELAAFVGSAITPSYSPDGRRLAFALTIATGVEVHEYDTANDCCLRRVSRGPRDDLSPTYSPDGRLMAFMSNRLGQPHIYMSPATGGEATLLSPFVYGEPGYYTSPDWSPTNSLVAFHGRSRGQMQIMVADASRPGATVQQITADGVSEDPSWAPDGRHVVFTGVRADGWGLYVIDTVTGRLRPLILGDRYLVPDWSPMLLPASALAVGSSSSVPTGLQGSPTP